MPLKATVLRVESDNAILKTMDDQELRFPIGEMDAIKAIPLKNKSANGLRLTAYGKMHFAVSRKLLAVGHTPIP